MACRRSRVGAWLAFLFVPGGLVWGVPQKQGGRLVAGCMHTGLLLLTSLFLPQPVWDGAGRSSRRGAVWGPRIWVGGVSLAIGKGGMPLEQHQ